MTGREPAEYVAEHVRRALTTDRRAHEQGLDVAVIGDMVVVRGTVATASLRGAVGEVVAEHPGVQRGPARDRQCVPAVRAAPTGRRPGGAAVPWSVRG